MSNTWQIQNTLDDYTNKEGNVTTSDSSIAILLNKYVLKEDGKGLSSNDFTDEDYNKLHSIECCAQVNKLETLTINCGDKIYPTSDKNINIPIPTKTSDLINDSFAKLINQSTESDYSDSYVGKSKVAFQDEEDIAIGKNADASCGGIAIGKNASTSESYDVNIADKLKHNSTTDVWEGTVSTSNVAITNSNGTNLNELDTKFTKVSELPSYIEEDTVVVYVGEDTEDLVSGGIYKGVPKLTTYLNYTDDETNLYFDLSTLESTSVSGVLKNQSSYNATNFSDGDGRDDLLLYYMVDSDTQIAKIYAYYSDNEIYEINSINWNTKRLTVGNSVEISEGGLLNQGSVSMVTYSQAEWSDVSTAVEEVLSLPQSLKNKIYNKTSSSTYSSGSSCYNSIESLYENFPKSISKLSEGSSGNYTHTYLIQSGNLSYNGVEVTKIVVNVSSSTNSYLYDGDTELVYLSDDVLVYDLIYTKMEVYSKDVQLATYDDIGFEDPATAVERDNNKSITSDAVSCYDGEVVINVSCSEYPITNLGDGTMVHGSMCVQNNVTIENNLSTTNIHDCCGGGLLLNNPSRMSDCCSYTPSGSLVDSKPIIYNCTDNTIETSDTLSIDSLNASTMSVCKAYVKELDTVKEETISSTGNHIVLRANNDSSMVSDETSGILIHNYDGCGKDVAFVSDNCGVVKVGTGTPTDTTYPTLYFNKCDDKYYTDITDSSTLISPSGAMTEWGSVENTDDYTKWTNVVFSEIDFTRISERNTYIVVGSEYFDTTASQTTTSGTEESSETVTTISDDTDLYNLADYSTVAMYLYNSILYALLYDGSTKIAIEINGVTDDGYYDGNANQDDTLYDTIESDGTLLLSDAFGEIAEYIVTESSLEPLTTRADTLDMNDQGLTKWNNTGNKIDTIAIPTASEQTLISVVDNGEVTYCWKDALNVKRYQPNDRLPVVRMVGVNCVNGCLVCFGNDDEGLLYCGSNTQIKSKNTTLNCCHSLAVNVNGIVSTACQISSPSFYTQTCQTRSAIINSAQDGSSCVSDRKDTLYGVTTCVQDCTNNSCCQKTIHQQHICCICDGVFNLFGCETAGLELSNAKVCAHTADNYVQVTNNAITNVTGDNVCKVARTSLASNCSSKEVYNTDNDCCKTGHFTNDFAANDYSATQSNDYTYFCDDCNHRESKTGVATSSQKVCTNDFAHLYGCWNDNNDVFCKGVCVKRDGVHVYMDDTSSTSNSVDWKFTNEICAHLDCTGGSIDTGAYVHIGQCINHRSSASAEDDDWTVDNLVYLNDVTANCNNKITRCLRDSDGCKYCSGIIQGNSSICNYACDVCGAGDAFICNAISSTSNRSAYEIMSADSDGSCICSNANADGCALIQHTATSGVYGATICQLAECSTGTSCIGMNASEVDITAGCINLNGDTYLGNVCSDLCVCGCLYANFPSVTWSIDPTTWCVSYS